MQFPLAASLPPQMCLHPCHQFYSNLSEIANTKANIFLLPPDCFGNVPAALFTDLIYNYLFKTCTKRNFFETPSVSSGEILTARFIYLVDVQMLA